MFDVTIIGGGPAGISAALYTKRANLSVAVLYAKESALDKATKIENYYGFPNGISGPELYKNGLEQAKNLGVEIRQSEVTGIQMSDDMTFVVETTSEKIPTKTVIIATGNKKLRPLIKGIETFEGKGVSYCAICDAFFYRNKDVIIIGNGKFALTEAQVLQPVAKSVKIFTNGAECNDLQTACDGKFPIETKKIAEIQGDAKVSGIKLEDGSTIQTDGIFIALGEAGAADFAKTLGLQLKGDSITINDSAETNIPGIYACGNATGGLLQVSKAVYEGTKAGLTAINFIRKGSN